MTTPTIHTSRYGMAVPITTDRGFKLKSVTSLRWRDFTAAMARVVDGVRMESDEPSLEPGTTSSLREPASSAGSHAG